MSKYSLSSDWGTSCNFTSNSKPFLLYNSSSLAICSRFFFVTSSALAISPSFAFSDAILTLSYASAIWSKDCFFSPISLKTSNIASALFWSLEKASVIAITPAMIPSAGRLVKNAAFKFAENVLTATDNERNPTFNNSVVFSVFVAFAAIFVANTALRDEPVCNACALKRARIPISEPPIVTTFSQLSISNLAESIAPFKVASFALPMLLSMMSILSFKLEILPCNVSACISCIL